MTVRIVNQRTGEQVAEHPTYVEAAEHRRTLRRQLDPTQECPYAIRSNPVLSQEVS